MAYTGPSGTSLFVPTPDATGHLVVGYSRNVKDFALNKYMQIWPVTQMIGQYWRWKSEQAARMLYTDGRDYEWPVGNDRPTGQGNFDLLEIEYFRCKRFDFPFMLPYESIEQAQVPIEAMDQAMTQQQCMTHRTLKALTALNNATWGTNQANVDGVAGALGGNAALLASGQNWANGTPTNPNLLISLQNAIRQINRLTLGSISGKDLVLVMGPDTAVAIRQSPEVQIFLEQQANSVDLLKHEGDFASEWGLPNKMYGVEFVVEGTVAVTSAQGAATLVNNYALPSGTAYLVSRPKGLVYNGLPGGQAFSTLTGFFYKEFEVEAFDEPKHKRIEGHVCTNFDMQITSPLGGYLFQRCLG